MSTSLRFDPLRIRLDDEGRALSEKIYYTSYQELQKLRQCGHCGATYREWYTLGMLPCRGHPGTLRSGRLDGSNRERWSCCDRKKAGMGIVDGCARADHLDKRNGNLFPHMFTSMSESVLPYPLFLCLPNLEERALKTVVYLGEDPFEKEETTKGSYCVPPSYQREEAYHKVRQATDYGARYEAFPLEWVHTNDPERVKREAIDVFETDDGLNLCSILVYMWKIGKPRNPRLMKYG